MFEKNEKSEGTRRPDFTNSKFGISVWRNKDKNGQEYLSVKVPLLNLNANLFSVKTEEELSVDEEVVH